MPNLREEEQQYASDFSARPALANAGIEAGLSNVHQGEGGEPLLDTLSVKRDEYLEALEKISNDNRSNVHDNTASDIPDDLETGALSSTINDGEAGRTSPAVLM